MREDPYAPHVTWGPTVRIGTAVGFVQGDGVDAVAIGGTTAIGHRFGRLALESEFTLLSIKARGGVGIKLGDGERFGLIARYDVVRLGPHVVGGNTLVAVYAEGGAAVAWNDWYRPSSGEPARLVPDDTKRVEAQAGFGLSIDYRMASDGFARRVGWFLGWRFALAPHEDPPIALCRGTSCRAEVRMTEGSVVDRSTLFQVSLAATW